MKISTWNWHREQGAEFTDYFGCEVPLHYGNPEEEYRLLREAAGVRDVSFFGKIRATGKDRNRFLNGMLTSEIKSLEPGNGVWAMALDIKGRIQTDMKVYAFEDHLLMVLPHYARETISAGLDRYIISEDVRLADVTDEFCMMQVLGPTAEALLRERGVNRLPDRLLSHTGLTLAGVSGSIIRLKIGFAVLFPSAGADAVLNLLSAPLIGARAFEVFRIEEGVPLLKKDMDENNFPQEARMDAALNFQKGCYLGQEVMARIDAQGHVNRHLMGIAAREDMSSGDRIYLQEKDIGWITSVTRSPVLGQNLALGYVRREHAKEGTEVRVGENRITATVRDLPVS